MSSSLWLVRDCFLAPEWKPPEHRVKSSNILPTVLQHYHLHTRGGKWWIFFFQGWNGTSLFISMVGQRRPCITSHNIAKMFSLHQSNKKFSHFYMHSQSAINVQAIINRPPRTLHRKAAFTYRLTRSFRN